MQQHLGRPLTLAADVRFTCSNCGACCRNDWLIGVDDAAWERLSGIDWSAADPTLARRETFATLPDALPGGETRTFARTACGACVFLADDARCTIHRHLGYEAKPQVCREFPYVFTETPDAVSVGLSFACSAVRARHGSSLADQASGVRHVLAGSTRVNQVPDPIVLYSGVDIGWDEYRPIEAALLAVLAREDHPLATCLVAGSALVSLCVGLAQVERRRRDETHAPPESVASALVRLESERHARLFQAAAALRAPRRVSLAHLAPLHAWLRLSRQHLGRGALVTALYLDYFRFRRVKGRVPDLVSGGAPLDLAAVARVRFTASAGTEAFLRTYWRHVLERKTLTPMHGVFRGYHTLLALSSFARWAAKVMALQAGRDATTLGDVQDAVRLVEQRFVLHSRFASVFALSAVLTILTDRLFGSPAFVPAAVLAE
jgi:Fe-S-cluster containining protein